MATKKPKTAKVITRRKKFIKVDIPLTRSTIELIGNSPEEIQGRTIKLDLTRQLKGKSVEATVKVNVEDEKIIANPIKIKLMPYFIRRMIRKRISYVEDSFQTPSQESMIQIKPFLITRKRVSRVVRKTLRNKCRNWIEDYIAERKDDEIFNEILSNRMQKPLSLMLKKTYPLSLCEIRILEIKRPLESKEIPKIQKKPKTSKEESEETTKSKETVEVLGEGLDQLAEIEEEKKKKAEEEIKRTQKKASEKEAIKEEETKEDIKEAKEIVKEKTKEKVKEKTKTEKKEEKEETKEKK